MNHAVVATIGTNKGANGRVVSALGCTLSVIRKRTSTGLDGARYSVRRIRFISAAAALLALGCGAPCVAAEVSASPVYIKVAAASFEHFLPPPPADESMAGQADITTVLWLQANRTPEQIAKAQELAGHTPFQMGARAWGPSFTPENLPRTAEIFKKIRAQTRPFILAAKGAWKRARPFLRDAKVQPCVPKPESTSFPSGHSAESALWAAILGAACPEKTAIFQEEVQITMWSRVLGGVHYPTDTQAGLKLGRELARLMMETEEMQSALAVIRAEIANSVK